MTRLNRRSRKAGLPPGTLIHIGEVKSEEVRITIVEYDEAKYREREAKTVEECFPSGDKPTTTWIGVSGIHDLEVIKKLGNHFGLHPLIMEDIANTHQRPKIEDFDSYIFIVLKIPSPDGQRHAIGVEQVSLIIGKNLVISFLEAGKDIFEPIRERLRSSKGRVRKLGADYLTYALIDALVDDYFITMEKFEESIEDLEEELAGGPTPDTLHSIHVCRRQVLHLYRSIWPVREVIAELGRMESPLVKNGTRIYVRDVYDHTVAIIDSMETFRETLTGMLEIYLSSISNRMSEIMLFLTMIGTIFIPLTFITGIYGMNFRYMPEVKWAWGYPLSLLIMLLIGVFMLISFRRKNWI